MNRYTPIGLGPIQNSYTLSRDISAIQVVPGPDGGRLGTVLQLPQGAQLRVCGEGFNERTVKVSCEGGNYFIFVEDLEPDLALAAKAFAS